jgi:2-oxoglutarate ferredoxin oxidoreductase subunit alpha
MNFISGCQAIARGALDAGARFYAACPNDPVSELSEVMAAELPRTGGKFIQMEDESAALAAAIGASSVGLKSFVSTSSPGFTLLQEQIGYAGLNESPVVIVNAMQYGPSTGLSSVPMQQEVFQSRFGANGDYPAAVLAPSSPKEAYDMTIYAFNLSETHRIPVIILIDQMIATMRETFDYRENPKLLTRTPPRHHFLLTGMPTDGEGFPTFDARELKQQQLRLYQKYLGIERLYSKFELEDANAAVIAYGTTARAARAAVKMAREKKHKAGFFKLLTLWPFPREELIRLSKRVKRLVIAEACASEQLANVIKSCCTGDCDYKLVKRFDGNLLTPKEIYDGITA